MKTFHKFIFLLLPFAMTACSKSDDPAANNITLRVTKTFKDTPIIRGGPNAADATGHPSAAGQTHRFCELKYVISNIRLVKAGGSDVGYQADNLDLGATVVNQAKPQTLEYVL